MSWFTPTGALLKIAPYVATAALAVGTYHFTPIIGPHARLVAAKVLQADTETRLGKWRDAAIGWEASFRKSEQARKDDAKAAVNAVQSSEDQCDARVAKARRSVRVIEEIVNEPFNRGADNCPLRDLVKPDLVRDAVNPGSR
jgi:hypothetical protein